MVRSLRRRFFNQFEIDLSREAWDRCRGMSKDQAMQEYLDEIRKVMQSSTVFFNELMRCVVLDYCNDATNR